MAEETVGRESKPSLTHDSEEVCSVCCDSLSSLGVVSLKCGHSFHSDCLVGLVEHQTGQHHVQCPNCQAIHGVKTGNMPTTGKMMYTRHTGYSLPGYADDGMIIIKYVFNNGVQDETHPNPGKPFHAKGFPRSAFLPQNGGGPAGALTKLRRNWPPLGATASWAWSNGGPKLHCLASAS